MKAVIQDVYGGPDVVRLADVDTPTIGDDEVLVRVRAAAVHPGDLLLMQGVPYMMRPMFGLRQPRKRTPGFDVAGHVEAVGTRVRDLRPGDEVFGEGEGSCAEYVAASSGALAPKPAGLTFEQAAAVPMSGLTALHALRDVAKVRPGQRVLINGAAGGIGTFAVQIGTALGAEVTGVCSTRNVDLVRGLGAARVIDYTREDFTRGGTRYDLILDNVANHSLSELRRALTPHGTLIPNNGTSGGRWFGPLPRMAQALAVSPLVGQHMRLFVSKANRADLEAISAMIDAGDVTPVIDRTYQLSET
ncbi:MAG TPA: NAD(P)-dependent alcohol dehydrogenase, partial [Euzebyales bacterium]|nr:NAD(P)-dependent alcohol dehydrogenase [Euzebyales bacterium]